MKTNDQTTEIRHQNDVIGTFTTNGQVQMAIVHDLGDKDGKAAFALHEKLDRAMAKSKPSKREEAVKSFRSLYPRLEMYLGLGKPMKEVLAAFNEVTHNKVCARTFRDLLDQERSRRDRDGNPICCLACHQPLNHAGIVDSMSSSDSLSLAGENADV